MSKIDSFMGFSNVNPIVSYLNDFHERFFDSGNVFLESKETYTHEDTDENGQPFSFNYKYCIEAQYCEGSIYYTLEMVPTPESLHPELQKKVANCSCVAENEIDYYDIFLYGLGIIMRHDCVDDCEEIDNDILDFITSIVTCVNSMRGFYLDRYINRIGSTGWDKIYEWVYNIDCCRAALDRWEKEQGK